MRTWSKWRISHLSIPCFLLSFVAHSVISWTLIIQYILYMMIIFACFRKAAGLCHTYMNVCVRFCNIVTSCTYSLTHELFIPFYQHCKIHHSWSLKNYSSDCQYSWKYKVYKIMKNSFSYKTPAGCTVRTRQRKCVKRSISKDYSKRYTYVHYIFIASPAISFVTSSLRYKNETVLTF